MLNRKYLLFLNACLLANSSLNAKEIKLTLDYSSDIPFSSYNIHTPHIPVELKPISADNIFGIKTAAVCSLGNPDCEGLHFKIDTQMDTRIICEEANYWYSDCPKGTYPFNSCPADPAYSENCLCDTNYYPNSRDYTKCRARESCSDDFGNYYRCNKCQEYLIPEDDCKAPKINTGSQTECIDSTTGTKYMSPYDCKCPSSYKICNAGNNEVPAGEICDYNPEGNSTIYSEACICPQGWTPCTYGGVAGAKKCTLNGTDYWSECKTCPDLGTLKECPVGYVCEYEECSGKYYTTGGCAEGYVSSDGGTTCVWGSGCMELNTFSSLHNAYYNKECQGLTKSGCLAATQGALFCPNGCSNAKSAFGGIYKEFVGSTCYVNTNKLCSLCPDIDCSKVSGVTVPANASCTESDSNCSEVCKAWVCNSGFAKNASTCKACSSLYSNLPENAFCTRYNEYCPSVCELFQCNSDYKNIGGKCQSCSSILGVNVPEHATCNKYDTECPDVCQKYSCENGYQDVKGECTACISEDEVQARLGKGEIIYRTISPSTTFCDVSWKRYLCEDKSMLIFGCKTAPSASGAGETDSTGLSTRGAIAWIKSRYCAGGHTKAQCTNNYTKIVLGMNATAELAGTIYGENFSVYVHNYSFTKYICDWCLD